MQQVNELKRHQYVACLPRPARHDVAASYFSDNLRPCGSPPQFACGSTLAAINGTRNTVGLVLIRCPQTFPRNTSPPLKHTSHPAHRSDIVAATGRIVTPFSFPLRCNAKAVKPSAISRMSAAKTKCDAFVPELYMVGLGNPYRSYRVRGQ